MFLLAVFGVFTKCAKDIVFLNIYIYIYVCVFSILARKKQPTSCSFPEDSRRTH